MSDKVKTGILVWPAAKVDNKKELLVAKWKLRIRDDTYVDCTAFGETAQAALEKLILSGITVTVSGYEKEFQGETELVVKHFESKDAPPSTNEKLVAQYGSLDAYRKFWEEITEERYKDGYVRARRREGNGIISWKWCKREDCLQVKFNSDGDLGWIEKIEFICEVLGHETVTQELIEWGASIKLQMNLPALPSKRSMRPGIPFSVEEYKKKRKSLVEHAYYLKRTPAVDFSKLDEDPFSDL